MSSVTSSFAQKSGRTKFLLGSANTATPTDLADYPAFTTTATIPTSVVTRAQLNGTASGFTVAGAAVAAALYKDLGRQVVVCDTAAGSLHTEVFREVTRMNGATTEGLADPAVMLFVKVYSATGTNVSVVRTG